MVQRRKDLKEEIKGTSSKEEKQKKEIEIRKIDQELKTEFYKILEDRGEEVPSVKPIGRIALEDVPTNVNEDFNAAIREDDQRRAQIRKDFVEDQREFAEQHRDHLKRLEEAEARMEAAQQEEYKRREAGKSSSVIPAAIKKSTGYSSSDNEKKDYIAGAVSATDSESETEFMTKIRGNREKGQIKWTPELEEKLEEILLKNQFEFRAASREFCKYVNETSPIFYTVDVKQL